jgi:hypothetical protein
MTPEEQASLDSVMERAGGPSQTPNKPLGAARAFFEQGLGMGWGDEAEAYLRSKLGQGSYEENMAKINQEQGQYAKENPYTSGGLEFIGGVVPGIASMALPGGQLTGAAQLARLVGMGAGQGAITGAGAQPDNRAAGAGSGAAIGGGLGLAIPGVAKGGSEALKWLSERLAPTAANVTKRATEKLGSALKQTGTRPQDITTQMAEDSARGVPSVLANTSRGAVDLAETVAQRTGEGARKIEDALWDQRLGAKERTYSQVNKGLNPGEYYDDLQDLMLEMKTKSAPLYQAAYAKGVVNDPAVLQYLTLPQFKQGAKAAEKLLAAEGRTVDMSQPTVEALDQVKRGLDALIEKETDAITGKTTSLGRVYTIKKNEFLNALDAAVPEYAQARAIYKGDADILRSMQSGLNEFARTPHEVVSKEVAKMSNAELQAYRTGVARSLYSTIMNPARNSNAAQHIIGSKEMQQKLQPLFDNPGAFDLFKAALSRESQLFQQSGQVLTGSQTGKRMQMRDLFEGQDDVGQVIHDSINRGFVGSLLGLASRAIGKMSISDKVGARLAGMLMSKDPHEVAAVVKLLEDAANAAPKQALKGTMGTAGTISGVNAAIQPSPEPQEAPGDISIEDPMSSIPKRDIEADLLK